MGVGAVVYGQSSMEEEIDSLNHLINTTTDTIKANAFYELGKVYVKKDSLKKGIEVLEKGAIYSLSLIHI